MIKPDSESIIRILLVEDDVESAGALRSIMVRRGLMVKVAASGTEAKQMFSLTDYDVVVSDIRLGDMDGVDLLAWIRERSDSFPVILLTGYSSLESAVQAVRLGANDYILKPLGDVDVLLQPVEQAVRHYRLILHNHRLARDLEDSQMQLRQLNARLLEAEESERERLGEELHDGVAQDLAGLGIIMDLAISAMGEECVGASQQLRKARGLLDDAICGIRNIVMDLLPQTLQVLGLEAAIREHAALVASRTGIRIRVAANGEPNLPLPESYALFRAIQEALANVVKHAGAKETLVTLDEADGRIILQVTDDGKGFNVADPVQQDGKGGWGLLLMRERIRFMGGRIDVTSVPAQGTTVRIEVRRHANGAD